jgi:hypothetical protein
MNHSRYEFQTSETFLDFEFLSNGPRGTIRKAIRYTPCNIGGTTYFNLAFGDWNDATAKIDDCSNSNNHDTQKVLATVAATVLDFITAYPDMPVYAEGSTPARTRLYQMGISANFKEIEPLLVVHALKNDGDWELFKRGTNYKAFVAWRKINA